jgi:hypothetical protein
MSCPQGMQTGLLATRSGGNIFHPPCGSYRYLHFRRCVFAAGAREEDATRAFAGRSVVETSVNAAIANQLVSAAARAIGL